MIVRTFLLLILASESLSFRCGIKVKSSGLAVNGTVSKENEWPWLVSLFNAQSKKFFCGATIVSEFHVLTAAHCIQRKGMTLRLKETEVLVMLGKHNLTAVEDGSEWFYPYEILIHPDWNVVDKRYDADLALITAEVQIPFSEKILPVCLWMELEDDDNVIGTVVGWGASENTNSLGNEDIPREVEVKRVPSVLCYEEFHLLASVATSRTFCGGGVVKNSGPCTGDSGGGFYVEDNGIWYIQGIVSSSFLSKTKTCDVSKYSLYTKLNEFLSWISLKDKFIEIQLQCTFNNFLRLGSVMLQCRSEGLTVLQPNSKLVMEAKESDSKVKMLDIAHENIPYLPVNLGILFPNLSHIRVNESNLRFIERKNFDRMTGVQAMILKRNLIKNIPFDSFFDLPNLQNLTISSNKLVLLPKDIFSQNIHLNHLDLENNELEVLHRGLFRNNIHLISLNLGKNKLNNIEGNIFDGLSELMSIDLTYNLIQSIPTEIFKSLANVIAIAMTSNRLRKLHKDTFSRNFNLIALGLGQNRLDELEPELLRNNLNLIDSRFFDNKIKVFPNRIYNNLTLVRWVYFTNNFITEIPFDGLLDLINLEQIIIRHNKLTNIHIDTFVNNMNLVDIEVSQNQIIKLEPGLFRNNLKLKRILIGQNRISKINKEIFKNLTNLNFLDLSFNLIQEIPFDTFYDLKNIENIILRNNRIKSLHEDLFIRNSNLLFINADGNNIEHLPAELFKANNKLNSIAFVNNNLKKIYFVLDSNKNYALLSFLNNVCIDDAKLSDFYGNLKNILNAIERHC